MERDGEIRVLIVDDHERVRAAMRSLLAAANGIEVVGLARDGAEAVLLASELRPAVVLMDIAMPAMDGVEATRLIKAENPAVGVVVLTALPGRERDVFDAGASALLLKDASPADLVRRIRSVAATHAVR